MIKLNKMDKYKVKSIDKNKLTYRNSFPKENRIEKENNLEKFAHKTSFDLFKRNKKRYIFEGTFDRSMRTDSWRDKDQNYDNKKEEDKSFTIVSNIKKHQYTDYDQYKQYRDKAITSYGIIPYTWIRNINNDGKVTKELKFLLPQRRDTIHYMEFPRYKGSEHMIKKIITLMTKEEKKTNYELLSFEYIGRFMV